MRSPDYLNLALRTVLDQLECLSCDNEILDGEDRVHIHRAINFVNKVRFKVYPVTLSVLDGGKK